MEVWLQNRGTQNNTLDTGGESGELPLTLHFRNPATDAQ
jgi:hypothetical protein